MVRSLAEYLTYYTTTEQAYTATAFLPVFCSCGHDRFTLDRAGAATRRKCTQCGQVRFINRFGNDESWLESVEDQMSEEAYFCQACGSNQAHVCIGFGGYPESPGLDAIKWYYVGVRCAACGADECFNDGKVGRGPMTDAVFRQVSGEQSQAPDGAPNVTEDGGK